MGTNMTVTLKPQTLWEKRKLRSSSECTLLVSGTNKYTATATSLTLIPLLISAEGLLVVVPVFEKIIIHIHIFEY